MMAVDDSESMIHNHSGQLACEVREDTRRTIGREERVVGEEGYGQSFLVGWVVQLWSAFSSWLSAALLE